MNRLITRRRLSTLSAVALGAVILLVLSRRFHHYTDIEVYRMGGRAWRTGLPLYVDGWDRAMGGIGLAFTYPPFAAELFAVLDLLGATGALVLIAVLGAVGLAVTVSVTADRTPPPGARALWARRPVLVLLVAAVAACLLEPVRRTLGFGQVNLILMGMIAADCLTPRPRWPRGVLIGIAAAIKLTPIMFVLFFLIEPRWRVIRTIALSFSACLTLGWLLAPSDSLTYWTHTVIDPTRIGGVIHGSNQSWRGVLARAGVEGTGPWWACVLITLVIAVLAARRLRSRGADVAAMCVIAAATLLTSPISWSHHWVWIVPALILLLARRAWWWAACVAGVFAVGAHWVVMKQEVVWTWEHAIGNAYVALACVFILFAALCPDRLAGGGGSRRVMSIEAPPSSGRAEQAMNPAAS